MINKMTFGIFALVFSALSGLNTFSMEKNTETENWTETFKTKVGYVIHTPSFVRLGGIQGRSLKLDTPRINDIILKAPVDLSVNLTREQFIESMKKSGIF